MTRLVIPGWSILPRYFADLFPNDNLVVLNPFIIDDHQLSAYCEQELASEDVALINQSIEDAMTGNINRVFIFSMGLQWVSEHALHLLNMPCDIASPAVSYDSSELDVMITHLRTSKLAVLRSFYRRCFHSNDDWLKWKQQAFESHVTYNDEAILIEWLDYYGRLLVDIPNTDTITLWLDPLDPIGLKPLVNHNEMKIKQLSRGHLIVKIVALAFLQLTKKQFYNLFCLFLLTCIIVF